MQANSQKRRARKTALEFAGYVAPAVFFITLFVGIPLPGTGAWTGSLIASLLEVDIKKSSIAIFCGLIMATVIMYVVSYGIVGNLIH